MEQEQDKTAVETREDIRPVSQKSARSRFFSELLSFAFIALLIVMPIRIFIAQPFIVNGASMEPSFYSGNYLIVDEISYRFEEPKRGDVIVFRPPDDPSIFLIKRIIGLPGEIITIEDGEITIENETNPDGFVLTEPYLTEETSGNTKMILANDEYFVLGDNRDQSSDSRVWGPLSEELIIGEAFLRLWPIEQVAILPGNYQFK